MASDTALRGVLFHQPTVRAEGFVGRVDDPTGSRVVAVQGPLSASERAAYLQALASVDGVLIQLDNAGSARVPAIEVSEERPLAPWLDAAQQAVVIARPDHYVFGAAIDHDAGLRLLEELKGALA